MMENAFFETTSYDYPIYDGNLLDDPIFSNIDPNIDCFVDPIIISNTDGTLTILDPALPEGVVTMTPDEINALMNDTILPDPMVIAAAQGARTFFGLPDAAVVRADDQTCMYPMFSETFFDDVVGFNKQQLVNMGITTREALDLVMTHEAAHAVFQNNWTFEGVNNGAWEQELACDFFAGTRAGMNDMSIDNFSEAMRNTMGADSHPTGNLRADFITRGEGFAKDFITENGREPTFDECMNHLNTHFGAREFDIAAARNTLIEFGEHQPF